MTVVSYGGALLDDAKTYYIQPADLYIANSVACKDNPSGLVLSAIGNVLPLKVFFKSSTGWKNELGFWDEKYLGYKVLHGTGSRQGSFSLQLVGLYNGDSTKPNQPLYIEAFGPVLDPAIPPNRGFVPCYWSDCGDDCRVGYYDTGGRCSVPGNTGFAQAPTCPSLCGLVWQEHKLCCPNPDEPPACGLQLTLTRSAATYFTAMACGTLSSGQQAISLRCADDEDTSVGFWGVTAYADFNDERTKMNSAFNNIGKAVYMVDVFSRLMPTKSPLENTLKVGGLNKDEVIYLNRSTKFRFVFSETIP
jgi:hypothetical protein